MVRGKGKAAATKRERDEKEKESPKKTPEKKGRGGKKGAKTEEKTYEIYYEFPADKRLIILGMGAIGRGILPMILRHIKIERSQIQVISSRDHEEAVAKEHGVAWTKVELKEDTYRALLTPYLKKGDMFLNVSACVSSLDVIKLCQELGVTYLDSSNETWDDSPEELHLTWGRYVAKERVLQKKDGMPTAHISSGANPGMVNHFVKHAIMRMARDEYGADTPIPQTQPEWAELARKLEIQLIQISERDTQRSSIARKPGEFSCTWCVSAMMDEASEPSQVPLGTHENLNKPISNRPDSQMRLDPNTPPTWFSGNFAGNNTVKSWNPVVGPFLGNLIPHDETFSCSKFLATADGKYRPTMYFAYQPSDDSLLSLRDWFGRYPAEPDNQRLMLNDIVSGADLLGVLVCRKGRKKSLWYGSLLDIDTARSRLPNTSATTLSVVATVLASLVWVLKNPTKGFVEADDVPFTDILPIILPYIEPMAEEYTEWTPLEGNEMRDDCWELRNAVIDAK